METNSVIVYPGLSYKLVGALYKVHNKLGSTYQEKYYQRAIAEELTRTGIPFVRELEIDLSYEGTKIGKYFIDFVVDKKIALEIKTVPFVNTTFRRQVLAYLSAADLKLGIIANFRTEKLSCIRIVNPRFDSLHSKD